MQLLDSEGNSRNFLHELRTDLVGDGTTAGAGQEHTGIVAIDAHVGFHALQELQRFLWLLRFVALVVLPQNCIAACIDHNRLYSCRTNVEPNQKFCIVVVRLMKRCLDGLRFKRSDLN